MSRLSTILSFFVAVSFWLSSVAVAKKAPSVEQSLMAGKLADADKTLSERLQHNGNDEQAAFELGVVQFLGAVEVLSQNLYRYGARPDLGRGQIPFLGAANPTGTNPNPEKLSYQAARAMLQKWVDDLAKAEAALAKVQGNSVKLPLHVGMIRLDFNGDGQATDQETLWRLYQGISDLNHAEGEIDVGSAAQKAPAPEQNAAAIEKKAKEFLICFDAGDAHWLRGYCHFLMALGEMVLAHDEQELFERTPNPKPPAVRPEPKVTPEMVGSWKNFRDDADQILDEKNLVPFWPPAPGPALNPHKIFPPPPPLTLALGIQGTAATPYLQKG